MDVGTSLLCVAVWLSGCSCGFVDVEICGDKREENSETRREEMIVIFSVFLEYVMFLY